MISLLLLDEGGIEVVYEELVCGAVQMTAPEPKGWF